MRRLKLTAATVLLVIIAVIIMQNLEPIKTNLIVGSLEMPLAALLVCTLLIGYVLGLLTTALWKVRSWRSQALAASQRAANGRAATGQLAHQTQTSPGTRPGGTAQGSAAAIESNPLSASHRGPT